MAVVFLNIFFWPRLSITFDTSCFSSVPHVLPSGSISMNQSLHHGFHSLYMDLWTVLCHGVPQNMDFSKGVKTSTIWFASRIRTIGYIWLLVPMMAAHHNGYLKGRTSFFLSCDLVLFSVSLIHWLFLIKKWRGYENCIVYLFILISHFHSCYIKKKLQIEQLVAFSIISAKRNKPGHYLYKKIKIHQHLILKANSIFTATLKVWKGWW